MSCCGSDSDVVDGSKLKRGLLNSNHLKDDSDTISTGNSALEDDRKGPMGDTFPTWVKDEFANNCYACLLQFNILTDRKHHCRRCRNGESIICMVDFIKGHVLSIILEM